MSREMFNLLKQAVVEELVQKKHPVLALNLDRNVREAYFAGIVFAAVLDDGQIEESEREWLADIALSLNMKDEVDDIIKRFSDANPKNKIDIGLEQVKALKGSGVANLFLCEFSQVWMSHEHDIAELSDYRRSLTRLMDVRYDEKFFAVFDEVASKVTTDPKAVYALRDYLDDEVIRYLFVEIDEIDKIFAEKLEEEERAVLPHPLKTVLDDAQKACYLSAIRRAVNETSDNALTKVQQKGLRHLAIALGLKDADAAAEGNEIALSPNSAMRSLAFFRYCDMARLFAMDGHPAFSAAQKQTLEDVVTSFKLVHEDAAFLKEYSAYLGKGKEAEAAQVVRDAQSKIRFPDGFIHYFTPNMKPIVLAGGDTAVGVYQIVDGHYRLEKTLNVGSQTRLVIKNAVIDFAPEAEFVLKDCASEISGSEFNGEKTKEDELVGNPFFSGSSCNDVKFEDCRFNGADCRAAIGIGGVGTKSLVTCSFNRLRGSELHPIVGVVPDGSGRINCDRCQWNDCSSSSFILSESKVSLDGCDFMNCIAQRSFIRCRLCEYSSMELTSDGWAHITTCLFEKCSCSGFVSGLYSYGRKNKMHSNCIIDSKDIGDNGGFTLEQLREVRAKNEKARSERKS